MNFNTLSYIIEIVETGSISKAATNLFMSQPTLSSHISSFEKEIGREIFIRGNRGIVLTNYGAEVYKEAKSLVEHFNITKNKLTSKVNDNKIKIASFGSPVINEVFFDVITEYDNNNYEFMINECGTDDAIKYVAERKSDIGIIVYTPNQINRLTQCLYHNGLEVKNLFSGWMKLHVSEKWNLARKSVITKNDLKDLLHVKLSYFTDGVFNLNYDIKELGIPEDNKVLITNSKLTYNEALNSFPSFSVVIDWNCQKKINPTLKRIPFENKEITVTCAVIKRKNEILKDELNSFIDKLIKAYGKELS